MQISSGQASLSLAMLKALGSQATAPAGAAAPTGPAAPIGPAAKSAAPASPAAEARLSQPTEGAAPGRHLPRGSFVDLRA